MRRDGTELDSPFYNDGVWVRWQRGRPRKMGGYTAISQLANGPVRAVYADSRNDVNTAHLFSQWGVQRLAFSSTDIGGSLDNRTPIGFAPNPALTWTHAAMYSGVGAPYAALVAAATPDLLDLASDAAGAVYAGDITTAAPLQPVADSRGPLAISGGVCVLQPFLFVYGSNGLIRNSNPNDFSAATGWTVGGSNLASTANVAGTKIVYGAPVRGGVSSPAGLFWAIDALLRVFFVGGTALWQYDTLSNPTSILSKRCVVELDGKFFWPGVDRFFMYNGVVQEVPNDMNQNWFFDNLNLAQRNKVWGTKIPRWGEIWWFYPRGQATECTDAIILNYREQTWYDAHLVRSAGDLATIIAKPLWAGSEDGQSTTRVPTGLLVQTTAAYASGATVLATTATAGATVGMLVTGDPAIPHGATISALTAGSVTLSAALTAALASGTVLNLMSMTTNFTLGETVTGGTSGAVGTTLRVTETAVNLTQVTGTFIPGEALTGAVGAATVNAAPTAQELDAIYQHEHGWDKVVGQQQTALPSSYTTQDFGFAVGDPFNDVPKTLDKQTRLIRVEPDFNQVGDLTLTLNGRSYASQPNAPVAVAACPAGAPFVDLRAQARILSLTVSSNTPGGFYEQGQVMVTLDLGDERPTVST